MTEPEQDTLSSRLLALGVKPHLKGHAYFLAGEQMLSGSGKMPSVHELAERCGTSDGHMEAALAMCVEVAKLRTGRNFRYAEELLRAAMSGRCMKGRAPRNIRGARLSYLGGCS